MIGITIALQLAAASLSNGPQEEIAVVAERADAVRVKGGVKDGEFYCQVTKSAGDIEINTIVCAAFEKCAPQMGAMIEAIEERAVTGRERRAAMRAAEAVFERCTTREEEEALTALADARWEARNEIQGEAE